MVDGRGAHLRSTLKAAPSSPPATETAMKNGDWTAQSLLSMTLSRVRDPKDSMPPSHLQIIEQLEEQVLTLFMNDDAAAGSVRAIAANGQAA